MCTNYVLIKKNGTAVLGEKLGVDPTDLIYSEIFRPGSLISVVRETKNGREITPATWWLFLKQTDQGLRPHPDYFSVNTNYAKLPKRPEYKKTRCIIPASAFVESQDGKYPHVLEPADGNAMAFGGLYKEWTDKTTGEIVYSASIITLKGHKALENIHRKSTPLWLPENSYNDWLDPTITNTDCFDELLEPALRADLKATPIDKVTSKNPVGESFLIQHS